jgi:hypothetical protein
MPGGILRSGIGHEGAPDRHARRTKTRNRRRAARRRAHQIAKTLVADNPDGVVLDYQVEVGNRRMRPCWARPSGESPPGPAASQQR